MGLPALPAPRADAAFHVGARTAFTSWRRWTGFRGASLLDIVREAGIPDTVIPYTLVEIDGVRVPCEWFRHVYPKAGAHVAVVALPGNGKSGATVIPQDTVRLLFGVLASAAGAFVPGMLGLSGVAAYAAGFGISVAGILVTNALIPPPLDPEDRQSYSVTGTRNQFAPYGRIPKVLGRVRVYPPFGAVAVTETEGNDQFVRLLFVLGYGPVQVEDLRIGSTPIKDLQGVEVQVLTGRAGDPENTLYAKDVYEETYPVVEDALGYAPQWGHWEKDGTTYPNWIMGAEWKPDPEVVVHETTGDTEEIGVDLTFPQGLFRAADGRQDPWRVDFHVQYRAAGPRNPRREDRGWLDVIPNPADVIRNQVPDRPDNYGTVYNWLADAEPRLADLYTRLTYALEYEEGAAHVETLGAVLDALRRALDTLSAAHGEDAGQEATRVAMVARITALIATLSKFPPGTPATDLLQDDLDQAGQMADFLQSMAEINRALNQGYADAEAESRITNPIIRWWIASQGLVGLFAVPPAGAWTAVERRGGVVRFGLRWPVAKGRYQVRVRRVSEETENDSIQDRCFWTSLRSYKSTPAFRTPKGARIAMVAMRLKAGEQVSGVLDQFSCLVRAEVPAWDPVGQAWSAPAVAYGRNPAWAFCDILRGAGNPRPVADSRLDLDGLATWAAFCETNGFTVDAVVNRDTTVLELLKQVCACGRAAFSVQGGKFGVVIDQPQDTPVQVFTPRNSRGFTASRPYRTMPHGLKVRYINPDAEWQEDEMLVFADGYGETDGVDVAAATVYEEFRLWGVTDSPTKVLQTGAANPYHTGLAWKHGRYALAQIQLRPEVFELTTDPEWLVCRRGDRVQVAHDTVKVGLGSGRVVATGTTVVGQIEWLDVDTPFYLAAGVDYAVRVRLASGAVTAPMRIQTVPGWNTRMVFLFPLVAPADPPLAGDLYWWGEYGKVDFDCLVKEIQPGADLGARLTLIPYHAAVYTADTGPIPDYDPRISDPPEIELPAPPAPDITAVQSDESVLVRLPNGTLQTRILVSLRTPPMNLARNHFIQTVQVDYRVTLDVEPTTGRLTAVRDAAWSTLSYPIDKGTRDISIAPVQDGDYYEFRVRYITNHHVAGPWTRNPSYRVVGKLTPPPNVDTLLFEGSRLRWFYPAPPLDHRGFKVRFAHGVGATWWSASPAHDGVIGGTFFDFNALGGGTKTFLVKAVDQAGILSERAAVAIKDLGDPTIGNVVWTDDHHALEWPGDKTGAVREVATGGLVATEDGVTFWQLDGTLFWRDDAALFWDTTYDPLTYVCTFTPTVDKLPAVLKIEADVVGDVWFLEYLQDTGVLLWPEFDADPVWPASLEYDYWPAGSAFIAWPGEVDAEPSTYTFRVRIVGGQTQGRVEAFKIHLDTREIHESVNDFIVDDLVNGNRVTLRNPFRVIVGVTVSIQQDVGYATARTVEVVDKNVTLGPKIRVYDASHNPVAGKVDVEVWGY